MMMLMKRDLVKFFIFWAALLGLFLLSGCSNTGTAKGSKNATASELLDICAYDYKNGAYRVSINDNSSRMYNYAQNNSLYYLNEMIYDMRGEIKYIYDLKAGTKDVFESEVPSIDIQEFVDSFKHQYQKFTIDESNNFYADNITIIYDGEEFTSKSMSVFTSEGRIIGIVFYVGYQLEINFDYNNTEIQIPEDAIQYVDLDVLGVDKYRFEINEEEKNIKVFINSTIKYLYLDFFTNYDFFSYNIYLDVDHKTQIQSYDLTEGRYYIYFNNGWRYAINKTSNNWTLDIEFSKELSEIRNYEKNNYLYSYVVDSELQEFELTIERLDFSVETVTVNKELVLGFSTAEVGEYQMGVPFGDQMVVLNYEVVDATVVEIPDYHIDFGYSNVFLPIKVENSSGEIEEVIIDNNNLVVEIGSMEVGEFIGKFVYGGQEYEFTYFVGDKEAIKDIYIQNNISRSFTDIPELLAFEVCYYDGTSETINIAKSSCSFVPNGEYNYMVYFDYEDEERIAFYYIYDGDFIINSYNSIAAGIFYQNQETEDLEVVAKNSEGIFIYFNLNIDIAKIDTSTVGKKEIKISLLDSELVYNYEVLTMEEYLKHEKSYIWSHGGIYLNAEQTLEIDEDYIFENMKIDGFDGTFDYETTREIIACATDKVIKKNNNSIIVELNFAGTIKVLTYEIMVNDDGEKITSITFSGDFDPVTDNAVMIRKSPRDNNFMLNFYDYFYSSTITFMNGDSIKLSLWDLQKYCELDLKLAEDSQNIYLLTVSQAGEIIDECYIILMEEEMPDNLYYITTNFLGLYIDLSVNLTLEYILACKGATSAVYVENGQVKNEGISQEYLLANITYKLIDNFVYYFNSDGYFIGKDRVYYYDSLNIPYQDIHFRTISFYIPLEYLKDLDYIKMFFLENAVAYATVKPNPNKPEINIDFDSHKVEHYFSGCDFTIIESYEFYTVVEIKANNEVITYIYIYPNT